MKERFLCVTPEAPIHAGTVKSRGEYLHTRDYVPGSLLRGTLAEWLKLQGRAQDIVQFVQKVRFGNLYPTPSTRIWALPFPLTALECKLKGGFCGIPKYFQETPGHGIRDSLLIALAYGELEKRGARFPVPMLLRCTHEDKEKEKQKRCGARMERVGGFYASLREGWKKLNLQKALQTKVALSRYRRAAQEKMLYRVVGIRPQGHFVGRIWVADDSVLQEIRQAVERLGIGALTTRGFGTVRASETEPSTSPLRRRLREFNDGLRVVWRDLYALARQVNGPPGIPSEPLGTYFSVDLLSPAVLRDPHGLPTLKLWLGRDGHWLEPVFWVTQSAFVGGFSTAWGLPKPTYLGAAMGSVYVFRVDESPEDENLLSWLGSLEACGVGQYVDEGLGEVVICHPFHKEVMPV